MNEQNVVSTIEDFGGVVPSRKGGGGGGRKAGPNLTRVRSLQPNQKAVFKLTLGPGESFDKAARAITAPLHRKGALAFPIKTRTNKEQNIVEVFRVTEDATAPVGATEGAAAQAASRSPGMTVQLPTPEPGHTLTATLPDGEKVMISSN